MPRVKESGAGSLDVHPKTGRLRYRIRGKSIYQRKSEPKAAFMRRVDAFKLQSNATAGTIYSLSIPELVQLHIEKLDVAESTAYQYRQLLQDHIVDAFWGMDAAATGTLQIEGVYSEMLAQGKSPDLVHRTHKLLSAAYDRGMRYELVHRNPVKLAERTQRVKVVERPFLPMAHIQPFLESVTDPFYQTFYRACLIIGGRPAEMRNIRRRDIDGGMVKIEGTKTRNAVRHVAMTARLQVDIQRHLKTHNHDRVFAGATGGERSGSSIMKKLRGDLEVYHRRVLMQKQPGLPVGVLDMRLHDLRHTAVYISIAQGFSHSELCQKFGWGNVPDTYKHLDQELAKTAALKLADI